MFSNLGLGNVQDEGMCLEVISQTIVLLVKDGIDPGVCCIFPFDKVADPESVIEPRIWQCLLEIRFQ
jgi:hypothetical protein